MLTVYFITFRVWEILSIHNNNNTDNDETRWHPVSKWNNSVIMFLCTLTLRESHNEHHVYGHEPQQVSHYHSVYHDYERPYGLETPVDENIRITSMYIKTICTWYIYGTMVQYGS